MTELKLIQVGNSVGVILPKEILAALNLDKGDSLYLTKAPDGLRLTLTSPDFQAQMTEARKIMKKRRAVLRELAK
jgi:putative addiction module antidote